MNLNYKFQLQIPERTNRVFILMIGGNWKQERMLWSTFIVITGENSLEVVHMSLEKNKLRCVHWLHFRSTSMWAECLMNWGRDKMAVISQMKFSIFVNEKFYILIISSLKFVPKGSNDNNPALVQIVAWGRIGNKPLSEPMLTWLTDQCMCS